MMIVGAALLFAAAGGGQTQPRTPRASSDMPANAWMRTPYELPTHDDLAPSLRHFRDEYWDGMLGHFGALTPQTVIHTSEGAYGPSVGGSREIPDLRSDNAAMIGTFSRYRSVVTASGRAIYTDITFAVDHVFRDAAGGHGVSGSEITVGFGGGSVRTASGGVISLMTEPRKYFMQPGRTYLLFLTYKAYGDFYVGGIPTWDLSDGTVTANFDEVKAKEHGTKMTLIGLTKEELIRLLDERFAAR
jgi:hypothetical protein